MSLRKPLGRRHSNSSSRSSPSDVLCFTTLLSFLCVLSSPTTVSALVLLQRPFSLQSTCLSRSLPSCSSSSSSSSSPSSSSSTPSPSSMLFPRCGGSSSSRSSTRLHSSSTATVPLSSSPPSSTITSSIRGSASEIILPDGCVLSLNFKPRSWFSRVLAYMAAASLAVGRRKFLPFSPKFRWHFKGLEKVAHPILTGGMISIVVVLMEAYVYMIPLRQMQLQWLFLPKVVPAEMLGLPASRFVEVLRRVRRSSSSSSSSSSTDSSMTSSSSGAASSSSSPSSSSSSSAATASVPTKKSHLKLHALVHRHQPSPSFLPPSSKEILLHCNHGFGANSLSYEPVLESLSSTLGQLYPTLAAAHDAPGFGLSDSPADEREGGEREEGGEEGGLYTFESNARLGGRLMEVLREKGGREGGGEEQHVFLGHSMGGLSSAYMALNKLKSQDEGESGREEGHASPPPPVTLILVAPAIMPMRRAPSRLPPAGRAFLPRVFPERLLRFLSSKTGPALHSLLLVLTSSFLRSLCYSEKFWRDGLGVAWGEGGPPSSLTLAHYRLPSLKEGWERGLSRFVLAPLFARRKGGREGGEEGGREGGLVEMLAGRVREGRLRVLIMHGTKDRVVAIGNSRRLAEAMREGGKEGGREGGVEVMEIEGVGHVPHEEVPERFVQAVVEFVRREG